MYPTRRSSDIIMASVAGIAFVLACNLSACVNAESIASNSADATLAIEAIALEKTEPEGITHGACKLSAAAHGTGGLNATTHGACELPACQQDAIC